MAGPVNIIRRSVGFGGANQLPDVQIVQKLINAVPVARGGPTPALVVDGLCGPLTCGAIRSFQTKHIGSADGRIDPGQRTMELLLALLDALGLLAGLLPGASAPASQPSSPAGARSPIRERFMDICRQILPPYGTLTAGTKSGATGTGCGEFPGRVFGRVPVIPPGMPGAFKVKLGGQNCFLTTPMTAWEQFAKAVDQQYAPARTWVNFGGNRPLPGDIYILGKYENPGAFQHVGIIVSADGNRWMTADGGQGGGWQSGFVKREFHADGRIDGEFGNKARLRGWVDLDALSAIAVAALPANL